MKIYNNSDTNIPVLAQQELERGFTNIGYQGESVTATRVKSYDDSDHYEIYDEDGSLLFTLDTDENYPVIY